MMTIKRLFVFSILIGAFSVLIALGTWQMQRLEWKEALLAQIDKNLNSEPVEMSNINALMTTGEAIEYRPVKVSGAFMHDKERHFFATHKGRVGYYVYTPFAYEGGLVFINRGFVHIDNKSAETRLEGQVDGIVQVIGLARQMLDDKPSSLVPDNEPEKNEFFWKDLRVMASSVGLDFSDAQLQKFFIDADETPNPGGYPQGGVTLINLPNSHLQYAVTWYGLAGALVCVAGFFFFRRNADDA